MKNIIKVAVLGSTGYTGLELINILYKHPKVDIIFLGSKNSKEKKLQNIYSIFKKYKLPVLKDYSEMNYKNVDLVFLSLPHKISQKIICKNYGKTKFIDLSADFRLKNHKIYLENYKTKHLCKNLLKKFIYGLPELNYNSIKSASNIAIPGCYPTSILIPLAPLINKKLIKTDNIIIDSKSGYSGAGKKFNIEKLIKKNNLNFYNYNTNQHRHICEIKQELEKFTSEEIEFSFNPHILPIFRGMMSSIYCDINNQNTLDQINTSLSNFYKDYKNIEIYSGDQRADFNCVQNTNKCIIKIFKHYSKSKITIVSLIDNLNKGAAGQAIQCMLGMQRN